MVVEAEVAGGDSDSESHHLEHTYTMNRQRPLVVNTIFVKDEFPMRKLVYSLTTLTVLGLCSGCSQSGTLGSFGAKKSEEAPLKTAEASDQSMQFELARSAEKQGQLLQAQEMYLHMLDESPQDTQTLHRLGVVSSRLDQFDQASHYFMQALRHDKHNSEVLADLGYALYLKGDLRASETALRQATRENSNNDRAINNLAMVVGQQGRSQEAYALFRSVVDEAEANSNLAYVMSRSGDTDQAAKRYSVALTIDEDLEKAQVALLQLAEKQQVAQRLENLRDSQSEIRTAEVTPEVPTRRRQLEVHPVSSTSDDKWYDEKSSEFELPAMLDGIE